MSKTSRATPRTPSTTPIQIQVTGDDTPGIAAYAEDRLRQALINVRVPVLHTRARLTRYRDPSLAKPFVIQVNIDLNGQLVRAQLCAASAREAIDLVSDRLRRRLRHVLERQQGSWEDRRGRPVPGSNRAEGRIGHEASSRPTHQHRPVGERDVVRRKTVTSGPLDISRAVTALEDLDYDFYLFTEIDSGQDSVLDRTRDGYRLAQVRPQADGRPDPDAEPGPSGQSMTVSPLPVPHLSIGEAALHLGVEDRAFLFFEDAGSGRGAVVYRRFDGDYGLVAMASSAMASSQSAT
jgi:ribosome-associated translation inhibitor RaiA